MTEYPPSQNKRGYYSREVAALSGMNLKRVNEIVRAGIIVPSIRKAPRMGMPSLWSRSDIDAVKKISDALKRIEMIQQSTGVKFRVAPTNPLLKSALMKIGIARKRDIVITGPKGSSMLGPAATLVSAIHKVGTPVLVLSIAT